MNLTTEVDHNVKLLKIRGYYDLVDYLEICRDPVLDSLEAYEPLIFLNFCELLENEY
tara:strand:- start:3365 stop:3535 length:171 start_codon:yes stop_codon:yes gene_type:complete